MLNTSLDLTGSLAIYQGETSALVITYSDQDGNAYDLTDHAATASVKHNVTDALPSASFTCSILEPVTSGSLQLLMNADTTAQLSGGCYRWDLRLVTGSQVKYALYGKVDVIGRITNE